MFIKSFVLLWVPPPFFFLHLLNLILTRFSSWTLVPLLFPILLTSIPPTYSRLPLSRNTHPPFHHLEPGNWVFQSLSRSFSISFIRLRVQPCIRVRQSVVVPVRDFFLTLRVLSCLVEVVWVDKTRTDGHKTNDVSVEVSLGVLYPLTTFPLQFTVT